MTGLIRYLARRHDLKKNASANPIGIIGLDKVRTAVLFLDALDADASAIIEAARKFFKKNSVTLYIYAINFDKKQLFAESGIEAEFIHRNHINWYGRIKNKKGVPEIQRECELFISLVSEPLYLVEREARCSRATLKITRRAAPYSSIEIQDVPGVESPQMTAFETVSNILSQIK